MAWTQFFAHISPPRPPNPPFSWSPFLCPHPASESTYFLLGWISSSSCFCVWIFNCIIKEGEGGCSDCVWNSADVLLPTASDNCDSKFPTCWNWNCTPFMLGSLWFLKFTFKTLCICISFCFFILSQVKAIWEEDPQLENACFKLVYRQVCGTFSWWLMWEGPVHCGRSHPWAGGPGCCKKTVWASLLWKLIQPVAFGLRAH